jgi:hypothetical protein
MCASQDFLKRKDFLNVYPVQEGVNLDCKIEYVVTSEILLYILITIICTPIWHSFVALPLQLKSAYSLVLIISATILNKN